MTTEPARASLPPLFAALRHRRPDVDIVLLDPGPPAQPDPEQDLGVGVPDAEVGAAVERVDGLARELAAVAGADGRVRSRLGFGTDEGTVVPRCRCSARHPEGHRALADLRDRLVADGWRPGVSPGAVAGLLARRDDLTVRATYAAGAEALLVDVSGPRLAVGRARARRLVGRA